MKPEQTYTIEQFIESGKTITMSYDRLALMDKLNDAEFISYNILNDYLDDLKEISVAVQFNDKEFFKYEFKPKLLSYDIYGSTELFFIILALNGMCDVKQFNLKKIKMLKKDAMQEFLTLIYNAEKETILKNREKLEKI